MGLETMNKEDILLSQNGSDKEASGYFQSFWMSEDFTDVTLATLDDHQIRAHRVILSSCSPFLRKLMMRNQQKNQLIYFSNVRFVDLQKLIEFIYLGYCEVAQENLSLVLAAAKLLQIQGLCENGDKEGISDTNLVKLENPKPNIENKGNISETKGYKKEEQVLEEKEDKHITPQNQHASQDAVDDDRNSNALGDKNRFCDKCNYVSKGIRDLKRHKEAVHEGKLYQCEYCDYKASQFRNLTIHKESVHLKAKLVKCDLCDYKSVKKNMKTHKESIHDRIRHSCDQCDYKSAQAGLLRIHKQTQHEGIKYECDQCSYTVNWPSSIKRHKRTQHESIVLNCDHCNYRTKEQNKLLAHVNAKHNNTDPETPLLDGSTSKLVIKPE